MHLNYILKYTVISVIRYSNQLILLVNKRLYVVMLWLK